MQLTDEERRRLLRYYDDAERARIERRKQDAKLLLDQINALLNDKDPERPHGKEGGSPLNKSARPLLELLALGPDALDRLASSGDPEQEGNAFQPSLPTPYARLSSDQQRHVTDFLTAHAESHAVNTPAARAAAQDRLHAMIQRLDRSTVEFWTAKSTDRGGKLASQDLYFTVRFPGQPNPGGGYGILIAPAVPKPDNAASDPPVTDEGAPIAARDPPGGPPPGERRICLFRTRARGCRQREYRRGQLHARSALCRPAHAATLASLAAQIAVKFNAPHAWARGVLLFRKDRWEDRLPEEPTAETLDTLSAALHKEFMLSTHQMSWLAAHLTRQHSAASRGGMKSLKDMAGRQIERDMRGEAKDLAEHYAMYRWCAQLPADDLHRIRDRAGPNERSEGRGLRRADPSRD